MVNVNASDEEEDEIFTFHQDTIVNRCFIEQLI
jgi:hypothetical protein